jgi:arylsulfatase A-like enzyme
VPLIVRWPGRVLPARVSAHVGYLGDFFATFASIVGRPLPRGLDSVSFTPTLLGDTGSQQTHDCLYWEFYENGGAQAVRFGSWKAVRKAMGTGPVELYDLASDPGERHDVAASNPATVERAKGFMDRAHTSDPRWVVR